MNSNQATIQKLEKMGMWGMMRALRLSMEAGSNADFTPDELVSHLVDAEWDERSNRRLTRLLKIARFRYQAGLEDIDFGLKRNMEKNQLMRLADCRWVQENQDFLRLKTRLAQAAHRWRESGRDHDFLLPPGKPLAEATLAEMDQLWEEAKKAGI